MAAKTTKLRKSGGAVIVTIPRAYLDSIGLEVDDSVLMEVVDDKIVIARQHAGRIGLAARLAMCEGGPLTAAEREWVDAPSVGKEVL